MPNKSDNTSVNGKILLVEDDQSLSDWIKDYLTLKHYDVDQSFKGEHGVSQALKWQPDIVILDLNLPDIDGIEVCKRLRPIFKGRIIMLTARNSDEDEISGLEHGADDYLTKPVRANVLLARISTQFRYLTTLLAGYDEQDKSQSVRLGSLYVNYATRSVILRGELIDVTTKEFEVLWHLVQKTGEIVTRDELTKSLRGFEYDGFDRSVDLTISRLRRKLNDNLKNTHKIVTIRSQGYILAKDAWH